MAIGYRVIAPLVLAKDKDGVTHHVYGGDSPTLGPSTIEWLSDEQAKHFLAEGLVVEVEIETAEETAAVALTDRVAQCIEALAELDVPHDCAAPAARAALRDNDVKFGNDVIAAAVKARKANLSGTTKALSGTVAGGQ